MDQPEAGAGFKSASGGGRRWATSTLGWGWAGAFQEGMSHAPQVLLRRSPPGFQIS